MTFSILIPTYNGALTLKETLKSILFQSFGSFEIIICDDGSTDNTIEVVKSFQDQRIKIFAFKENVGYAKNLQRCFERANGEIIFLFAQDDILAAGALQKTYDAFFLADDIGAVTRPYFWFETDIKKPVRAVLPLDKSSTKNLVLDKNQDKIISIFDGDKIFNHVMWSVGQLSGLALKKEFMTEPVGEECFTAHIYPFLTIFKNHKIVFLKDYTVAVSIHTSQSRSHSEIYDIPPTESWLKMYRAVLAEEKYKQPRQWGMNKMAKNFVGLMQIKTSASQKHLWREIKLLLKYRWQNIFHPLFWFYSVGCLILPAQILRPLADWYKNKINTRFLPEIKFEPQK